MNAAIEKFNKHYTEIVKKIDKGFSDLKAGERMLISSPKSIAKYISKIPYGTRKSIKEMRLELENNLCRQYLSAYYWNILADSN